MKQLVSADSLLQSGQVQVCYDSRRVALEWEPRGSAVQVQASVGV